MSLRLMTCLLLLGVSLTVAARDVQVSGANSGGGTCPELAADDGDAPRSSGAGKAVPATAQGRSDKPTVRRGGSETAVRPPRWHSFLPGMFR